MLTSDTKRKIDSARDILVGKVPDPKAQVEQITNALIYKFMDDMDQEAINLGGKSRFFSNGYEKYAWSKLMDPKLGGLERLDLYVEAITHLSQNPHLPPLFRDIFKDAFLPYRNPETLSLFLKQVNEFTYHHSEELGNSFEYLLSVLGSQGDAGQFRTPRHIIDFIVAVVNPRKTDRVLDPACGTAGFLISAYKHILASHDGKDATTGETTGTETRLTPDERKRLVKSIVGYDISPDMVKLSRVNMYLHGFPEPHISEYDTLSSEDKWDDTFDVILANPPFMTPKGGIRPHKRFQVQASRAEVLFVDYIIEHLQPDGRAGVIVPDGVLVNDGANFNNLRKMMLDNGLFAIVSLPVGTFQPYSANIKTSILFFDRKLTAKEDVLFFDLQYDGFGLGKQRKPILQNDLPTVTAAITDFLASKDISGPQISLLKKSLIRENSSHYLNHRLYSVHKNSGTWLRIGDIFKLEKGKLQSSKNTEGEYDFITASDEWKKHTEFTHDGEALVFAMGAAGSLGRVHYVNGKFIASDLVFIITPKNPQEKPVDLLYYYDYLSLMRTTIVKTLAKGAAKKAINAKDFNNYLVPYPSIQKQKEIVKQVAEIKKSISQERKIIEERQKIITGYKEKIKEKIENI